MKNISIISFAVCIMVFSSIIALGVEDYGAEIDGVIKAYSTDSNDNSAFERFNDNPSTADSGGEALNSFTVEYKTNILYDEHGRQVSWDIKRKHWQHYNPDKNNSDKIDWKWTTETEHVEVYKDPKTGEYAFDAVGRPLHIRSVTTDDEGNTSNSESWMEYKDGRLSYQKTVTTNAEDETTTQIQNNMQYDGYGNVSSVDISITNTDGTVVTIRRHNMQYKDGLLVYYQDDITNTDGTKDYTETTQTYYSDGLVKTSETERRQTGE